MLGGRSVPSHNDLSIIETGSGEARSFHGHSDNICSVVFSPDGALAATASFDQAIRIWEVATDACLRRLACGYGGALAFNSDGRLLLAGSGQVGAWDLFRGIKIWACPAPAEAGALTTLALSPDERTLLTCHADSIVRTWEIVAGLARASRAPRGPLRALAGHESPVLRLALTPDGRAAISASADATLRVWDLVPGTCRHILAGHSGAVLGVAVTADGRTALSASEDRTIRIWDLGSGRCEGVYHAAKKVLGLSRIGPGGEFACVTAGNEIRKLTLRRVAQEAPPVTAVRLFRFEKLRPSRSETVPDQPPILSTGKGLPGRYDPEVTARCPWCLRRFPIPAAVAASVDHLGEAAGGLTLDEAAGRDPGLLSECPICNGRLRFNPFFVDGLKDAK